MARRGYPPEFRKRIIELVEGGRRVAEIANDLGISEQTIGLTSFGSPTSRTSQPGRASSMSRS
jgi:hypothetical protein